MNNNAKPKPSVWSKIKKQLMKYHMIILILLAVIIGLVFPAPGAYMAKTPFSSICIMIIFFISGLKLNLEQIKKALHAWPAALFGCVYILLFTPIIGWLLLFIPLTPSELIIGLACVTCAPSTMASSAILTEQCGGNFGCALLLSVGTNLLGIFVVPFTVSLMFNASGVTIELDAIGMLLELLYQIAIPMLLGNFISTFIPGVSKLVKRYNTILKLVSSFFLCCIPWQKMSASADKMRVLSILELFESIGITICTNMFFYVTSLGLSKAFCFSWDDIKATTLCCMGKTLPVSLTIVSYLPEALGDQGLLTLPCLINQFLQLITTSIISGCYSTEPTPTVLKDHVIAPVISVSPLASKDAESTMEQLTSPVDEKTMPITAKSEIIENDQHDHKHEEQATHIEVPPADVISPVITATAPTQGTSSSA